MHPVIRGRTLQHAGAVSLHFLSVSGCNFLFSLVSLTHVAVIVLTASCHPLDIERAYELGANCFVTKPLGLGGLIQFSAVKGLTALPIQRWVGLAVPCQPFCISEFPTAVKGLTALPIHGMGRAGSPLPAVLHF